MYETAPKTRLSHYLRTGQKIEGFQPDTYKSYDMCDLCGGTVYNLDLKSIRSERTARYRILLDRHKAEKLSGKTHKIWQTVGGPRTRASHDSANTQKVKIDEKFRVGNEKLFLPNDPKASIGETANCRCFVKYVAENVPIWPTGFNKVTEEFFPKPRVRFDGETERPHTGIDIRNFLGKPVFAILPGKVISVASNAKTGNNFIKIKHEGGLESSYSHTKSSVMVGQTVVAGQVIGHSDGSGTSDGKGGLAPHLHLVVRRNGSRVDPLTILKKPIKINGNISS